jgi:hypothetical protein
VFGNKYSFAELTRLLALDLSDTDMVAVLKAANATLPLPFRSDK